MFKLVLKARNLQGYRGQYPEQFGIGRHAQNLDAFALFYFVFEGNFQVQALGGAYIWRGDLTEGFWRYGFGGLI